MCHLDTQVEQLCQELTETQQVGFIQNQSNVSYIFTFMDMLIKGASLFN